MATLSSPKIFTRRVNAIYYNTTVIGAVINRLDSFIFVNRSRLQYQHSTAQLHSSLWYTHAHTCRFVSSQTARALTHIFVYFHQTQMADEFFYGK